MEAIILPATAPLADAVLNPRSSHAVVSWGAILVGALVAAAVSLILLALGSGLSLAAFSPWKSLGITPGSAALMTAIGLIVMQWIASGIGGFLTGRMRTRWIGTHPHEVFFRDTAHGLAAWSLSTLLVASLTLAGVSSVVGAGARAVTGAAPVLAQEAGSNAATPAPVSAYGLDTMFRPDQPASADNAADSRAQAIRIVANALATGSLPDADREFLTKLVAARTGVPQDAAQRRVDALIVEARAADEKARAAVDVARKQASLASLLTALSMMVGAFIASVAASLGGHHRDLHP